jgi:hypothetical protein
MKQLITFALLLPILFLCNAYFGEWWFVATVLIASLSFLIEIKLKYGNITGETIEKFFNTPIKPTSVFGETPEDKSPKVSISAGILIILGGTVLVVVALGLYFNFVAS